MTTKHLSVCGCNCPACDYFQKSECTGCSKIKGEVWWAKYTDSAICPIFNCVANEKKLHDCGSCSEIPCQLWKELKDPRFTDAEHYAGIEERMRNLRTN